MKRNNTMRILMLLIFIVVIFGCKTAEKKPEGTTEEEVVDTGILVVESSPIQAQVYLDGELKGETPFTLYNTPVGTYNIVVKKDGYSDFEKSAIVKVGMTEEIDATLTPLEPVKAMEEIKPVEEAKPENASAPMPSSNKINLSSFAMYHDFENAQFTDVRTSQSNLFSRKYGTYVHFTALTPAKIVVLNEPLKDVQKEDCIFSDAGIATLFSGQTLCVQTAGGSIVAVGGIWQTMPTELEWRLLS